jgi:hypothetical protein
LRNKIGPNHKKSPALIICLVISFLYLQVMIPVFSGYHTLIAAQTQTCANTLDQAEENYYEGKFDQAMSLVLECLKTTTDNTVKVRAYTIMLRTFIAKDNITSAKEIVHKILDINANYTPTIEQERPRLVNLVAEVKKERQISRMKFEKKESGGNTWLWIGAGGAAVIAAVVLLASGGGNGDEEPTEQDNTLPTPPSFP